VSASKKESASGLVKSHLVNIDYVWIILLYSEGNTTKLTIRGTSANGAKQGVWGRGEEQGRDSKSDSN
jgi:hypothetical protein